MIEEAMERAEEARRVLSGEIALFIAICGNQRRECSLWNVDFCRRGLLSAGHLVYLTCCARFSPNLRIVSVVLVAYDC